jgi:hypothetical protein
MDKAPGGHGDVPFYVKGRNRGRRRNAVINLTIRAENKLEMKKWANELFLDTPSDLLEYLIEKHKQGLLFLTEDRDFFAGMARSIEKRAEAIAVKAAEETTIRTLADRGFVDSPYRK